MNVSIYMYVAQVGWTFLFSCCDFFLLRMLKEKSVDGMYLIRGDSNRAGSEMILSVWHVDTCYHYRIFRDEVLEVISTSAVTHNVVNKPNLHCRGCHEEVVEYGLLVKKTVIVI